MTKQEAGMREEERMLGRLNKEEAGKVNDCWGQRNVSKANVNLAKLHQSFGSRKEARCNIRNLFLLNILKFLEFNSESFLIKFKQIVDGLHILIVPSIVTLS